jgi:pimeloyl-ACP methyl ester carboxylesterase
MVTNIFAIHGAFSSPRIFNFLRFRFGNGYQWDFLDYSSRTGGIYGLVDIARTNRDPCHLIGHSMGGLVALSVANEPWVRSITTVSCPVGGLDINILQACSSRSDFMNELSSHGEFMRRLSKTKIQRPVQHIVSTKGFHPWIYEPNDGVITIRSQTAASWGQTHEIPANHAEIMISDETVSMIRIFVESHSTGR